MPVHGRSAVMGLLSLIVIGCTTPTLRPTGTSGNFRDGNVPSVSTSADEPTKVNWCDIDGRVLLFDQPLAGAAVSLFEPRSGRVMSHEPIVTDGQGQFHATLPTEAAPGTVVVISATKGDLTLYALSVAGDPSGQATRTVTLDLFTSVVAKVTTAAFIPLLVCQADNPVLVQGVARLNALRATFVGLSADKVQDVRLATTLKSIVAKPTSDVLQQLAEAVVDYSPLQTPLSVLVETLNTATAAAIRAGGQRVTIPTWQYGSQRVAPAPADAVRGIDVMPLIDMSDRVLRNRSRSGSSGASYSPSGAGGGGGGSSGGDVDIQGTVADGPDYQGPIGFQP